jgi:hypothetical protein
MATNVQFINNLSLARAHHTHDTERDYAHTHGPGEHGHTHEHLDHPGGVTPGYYGSQTNAFLHVGKFSERDLPEYTSRNFEERGFTVGIGGYAENDGLCTYNCSTVSQPRRLWKNCFDSRSLSTPSNAVQRWYAFPNVTTEGLQPNLTPL